MISEANHIHKKNENFHQGKPLLLRAMFRCPLHPSRSRLRGRMREVKAGGWRVEAEAQVKVKVEIKSSGSKTQDKLCLPASRKY